VSANPKEDNMNNMVEITELAEQAFDQYEFDASVNLTTENYDIVRQVFIDAFVQGMEADNAINFGKALADMTLEEDKQFQARLDNIPHKEKA
jgi:hypothetical protein